MQSKIVWDTEMNLKLEHALNTPVYLTYAQVNIYVHDFSLCASFWVFVHARTLGASETSCLGVHVLRQHKAGQCKRDVIKP